MTGWGEAVTTVRDELGEMGDGGGWRVGVTGWGRGVALVGDELGEKGDNGG